MQMKQPVDVALYFMHDACPSLTVPEQLLPQFLRTRFYKVGRR